MLDFNNGRVPRGLWRTYFGARGFIVETCEHGCRKARVVRSVHCLRKISLRTAVMQQMVVLCRLFESFGQSGLTKGGTEVDFRCSLLAMLSAIDNQEPNDDGVDVPDNSTFFPAQQPATALTDFETAFGSLLQVRVGDAVTEIGELKSLARSTVMCYTENALSVFVHARW